MPFLCWLNPYRFPEAAKTLISCEKSQQSHKTVDVGFKTGRKISRYHFKNLSIYFSVLQLHLHKQVSLQNLLSINQ